jgi:hypothetical protein
MPPERSGAPALFVWAWAGEGDLPSVRAVIGSLRLPR